MNTRMHAIDCLISIAARRAARLVLSACAWLDFETTLPAEHRSTDRVKSLYGSATSHPLTPRKPLSRLQSLLTRLLSRCCPPPTNEEALRPRLFAPAKSSSSTTTVICPQLLGELGGGAHMSAGDGNGDGTST